MNAPLSTPKRVAIVFAGGPAPAANAVIAVAASSFRRRGAEVLGILHGYSALEEHRDEPLRLGEHYRMLEDRDLWGLRNSRGVIIGTARSNPGHRVACPADLDDPQKVEPLANVYRGLVRLGVDALVSIGGDGTLRTANFLYEFQRRLGADEPRFRIVHVPKTIDNDYRGIDFTFGFFTAVGVIAEELRNLRADAIATRSYFIVETMGRRAGWLAYGVAVAGEAHWVVGREDVVGPLAKQETVTDMDTGEETTRTYLDVDALVDKIVDLMIHREGRGKAYGTVVLAEGLAEMLPGTPVPEEGLEAASLGRFDLGRTVGARVAARYLERTGKRKKVTGIQLGYESRSSRPHAFDVLLGSQLGLGAYRALAEEHLDGHMVSATGQLDLRYVPFADLVDPNTLATHVRFVERGSDFHRLAEELGTQFQGRRK